MADDPEPARPPPPKSYVPITLLDGPTPSLPPRPDVEEGNGEPKMPPRPQPQRRVSSPAHEGSQNNAEEPSEPTPVKPERQKGKKAPPKPPVPYEVSKKPAVSDSNSQESPKPAPRRHTMAAAVRPSRPPKEPSPEAKTMEFNRPKLHPPDIMTEPLYASVKKNKSKTSDCPAPNMPAPPPPYGGKAMQNKSKEVPDIEKKERSATPEYMPVGGSQDTIKPPSSQPPPPSRPARPPAADASNTLPAVSRSANVGATSSSKSKKGKGKKRAEIVIMDAKPMDGNLIPSPTEVTSPPGVMASAQPTRPSFAPPAKRPSPPQPKKPPADASQPLSGGETQPTPSGKGEAAPQPPKHPPAPRPSPPQPSKSQPASRPSPPQPKHPPASRPSPPQPKHPPASRPAPPQPPRPGSRPSPPQPPKPGSRPSPPQPPKNLPASRPAPPHPPRNPPSSSQHSPPQPIKTVPTSINDRSTLSPQSTEPNASDSAVSAPPTDPDAISSSKPARTQGKAKPAPDAKRPPPPRPSRKEAVGKGGSQVDHSDGLSSSETAAKFTDLELMKQLSELGPPPDEEPPEIPAEVENTAAAFLDSESEGEEEKKASNAPPKSPSRGPSVTSDEGPATPKSPLPQTQQSEAKKGEKPGRPAAVPTTGRTASKKTPPLPAGRPPPPKVTRRQSQQVVEKESPCPNLDEELLSTKKAEETEEKEPCSTDVTSESAAPLKKAPSRRPPLPRQSSTQSAAKNSAVDEKESNAPAEPEGEQKEQEGGVPDTEKLPPAKKAPVIRRPPAPRPASRPRSMIVKASPEAIDGQGDMPAKSNDPPSNKPVAISTASDGEKTQGTEAVSVSDDGPKKPPPPAVPSTATKKSPVMKRPPAPRPTSRPRSMFVKSANISGQPTSPTLNSRPPPPRSPANLKKTPPSVKKPAVARPPAPRQPQENKQGGPAPPDTSVMSNSNPLPGEGEAAATELSLNDASASDASEMVSNDTGKIPEPETKQVRKPAAPLARRPPPPSFPKRKDTKSEVASTPPTTTTETLSPAASLNVEEKTDEIQSEQSTEDANIDKQQNPVSRTIAPEVQADNQPRDEDIKDSSEATQALQNEDRVPSKTAASRAKKFAIKKPPPPVKPKSRSPTPTAETVTPSHLPVSSADSSVETVSTEQKAKEDEQAALLSKKPSIKKPAPPVSAKPKSHSPTPVPTTPPLSPPPTVEGSGSESKEPASSPSLEPLPPVQAPPQGSIPASPEDLSKIQEHKLPPEFPVTDTITALPPETGEVEGSKNNDKVETVPAKEEQTLGSEITASSDQTDSPVQPTVSDKAVDSVQSRPLRPPPAARARPPPPRATQRAKLNKTVSLDSKEGRDKPPGSPSLVRESSVSSHSPTTRRASSPRQPRTSDTAADSSPSVVSSVKTSPKSSPKPPRPNVPPASPGLNKKTEPLSAPASSSGSSSPVASRPVPPPPSSTTTTTPSHPSTGPPKPPAPASRSGPPKRPAPAARPGPSKPPPPTAKPRSSNAPEYAAPSKPPPPSARPEPQRKTSSSSGKGPYATPAARKTVAPSRPDPSVPPKLPPRPIPGHPLYRYVCTEPHGIATTHHDANDEDELSYQEGDVIELIEKVDEHWFYAANADTGLSEGLVLASDLNIIKRLPGKTTVEGFEEGPCAVATHTFEGQSFDELSFNTGELIMLKSRYGDNWFRGKLINGKEGIFPKNFVEVVEELPEDAYEQPPEPQKETKPSATVSGPCCVATFSFTAENDGELDLAEGDQIELVRRESPEWLVGKLQGKEGIFPESFVKIIQDFPPGWDHKKPSTPKQTSSGPAKGAQVSTAIYDFDGQEGELTFKAGDKIKVVSRVNDEWVTGELKGKQGMFPAEFVDSVPASLPSAAAAAANDKKAEKKELTGLCKALYEFEGSNEDELSFVAGETIVTLKKVTDEWLKGRIGTREGIFPVDFVEILSEIPEAPSPSEKPTQPPASQAKTSDPTKKVTQPLMDDLMPKGVALSDYQSDDISFKAGDVLLLLTKEPGNQFMGENSRTGDLGTFPASYVDVQVPLP